MLGDLYSPLPAGGSPLQPRVAHWDLYFNHKYAKPAPPAVILLLLARNTIFHKTKLELGIMQTDLDEVTLQVGNKNGHNGRAPGVPILLFARHNLCNSIFSQCPTEKIGGGKKGGPRSLVALY